MTHVERFRNILEGKSVDRVPFFFFATQEMMEELSKYLETEIWKISDQRFEVGCRSLMINYNGKISKKYPDGSYDNMFGVRVKDQNYGKGSYVETIGNPLADAVSVDEVNRYTWPDAKDFDYTAAAEMLRQQAEYPFTIGYHAIGWYSWDMRGMGQFLEDLLINPELAEAIIEKVSDFCYENYKRTIEACSDFIGKNFLCIQLADDWATQESLMISIDLYKKFFKRHYRRIIDMAHSHGIKVEFHCCGSVVDLIPELIDTGVDVLNPVQTSARGMIPHKLKQEYGKDLIFSGGVDVQKLLPFAKPEKIKGEVKYLLDTLGRNGGYLFGPSHSIQVGTPPENIIAMYEAALEYYRGG